MNPLNSDSDLTLPGWDSSYTKDGLKAVVEEYHNPDRGEAVDNLKYFLERIIPVAAECDVNMAIHEDDPCWSIFGLPRIITCEENLDKFLKLVDDKHNGITLCTGSPGLLRQERRGKTGRQVRRHGKNPLCAIRECGCAGQWL